MGADWQSRNSKDYMKWKHFPQIFQRIFQMKARPEMDLFASRLLAQLPWYIAWYIAQYITLCFLTFFNKKQGFEKNISGLSKNNVDCGSQWQSQLWHQNLPRMSIDKPLLWSYHRHLLLNHQGQIHMFKTVSGKGCLRQEFQRRLPSLFQV